MINPEAINESLVEKIQQIFMSSIKYRFILNTDCNKVADSEKTPVIELFCSNFPVGKAVELTLKQGVKTTDSFFTIQGDIIQTDCLVYIGNKRIVNLDCLLYCSKCK